MVGKLGIFLLGAALAFIVDMWLRSKWIRHLPRTCSAPGCQRHSERAIFMIDRTGRLIQAWPLCEWCASSAQVVTRGSPLRYPTVGEYRTPYERIAIALNRQFNGEYFNIISYGTGWVWRRRTFTMGPITTTSHLSIQWVSPLEPGSYCKGRVNGLPVELDGLIETPHGAMIEIDVVRPRAVLPYRATVAAIVGPLFSSAPGGQEVEEPTS